MRIDLFLKKCSIVKNRSIAHKACENGIVKIDGQPVKASRNVLPGQRVSIDFTDRYLEFEILELPRGNVSKKASDQYYRILKDVPKQRNW